MYISISATKYHLSRNLRMMAFIYIWLAAAATCVHEQFHFFRIRKGLQSTLERSVCHILDEENRAF